MPRSLSSHNHVLQQSEQVGQATREVSLEMIIPADMGRRLGGKKRPKSKQKKMERRVPVLPGAACMSNTESLSPTKIMAK